MKLTEYQLLVIASYERWGYIPNQTDRIWYRTYIGELDKYRQTEGDRRDDREHEPDYISQYDDGPEHRGDPEYPFQDFNYGP